MNATETPEDARKYDVVILGAGYAGLMAALRLNRNNTPKLGGVAAADL
jgi:flavin-dependent dehydrogenase